MKNRTWTATVLASALVAGILWLGPAAQGDAHGGEAPAAAVRIGVFNAEAVFNRYPGQQQLQAQAQQMQAEMQQAAQAQDQAQMQQIHARMQQLQQEAVDGFFAAVRAALPQVARESGVSAVVQGVEYRADGVEEVDVTEALAAALAAAAPAAPAAPEREAPAEVILETP